jgi:hypothetical protein
MKPRYFLILVLTSLLTSELTEKETDIYEQRFYKTHDLSLV